MGAERRGSARIQASLEIQVLGKERRASMRRGDLSLTGVRIEALAVDVGEPGSIHTLRIASRDHVHRVEIGVRLVRVVHSRDLILGDSVSEAAFEFLPTAEEQRQAIRSILVHADAEGAGNTDRAATGLSIETDWQLRKGERIRVSVPSPKGGNVQYEGRAVRSRRSKSGSYRTKVELSDGASRDGHMHGDLGHVRAPTLLSLAAMEHMSGFLRLIGQTRVVTLYLRKGRIVDVEEPGNEVSRRSLIADVCEWDEGVFEMRLEAVDRPDQIGLPTNALLLHLATLQDEREKVA